MLVHKTEKLRHHSFSRCTFEIDYPWHMNLHYQVHLDDFRLCPHCGVQFKLDPDPFQTHKQKCKGKKPAPLRTFICDYCAMVYHKKGRFVHHIRNHVNEKRHACSFCPERFCEKIHLNRHLLSKHGIGGKFFCSRCSKPFLQRYLMIKHQDYCYRKSQ